VPDFNQLQQNSWGHGGLFGWQLSFCGPVAAADSLWWFDSKFEPNGSLPPAIHNIYPLVNPYGAWDDHHPKNVNRLTTLWPPPGWPITPPISPGKGELVEDLALYFKTDQPPGFGSGTVITDVYNGLQQYLVDHGLRQGYAVTKVKSPDYWWVAEEVERSEDVILLLGFWANPAAGIYERVGGHYVTLAGANKQGGYVAFSDPFWDRMEEKYPPNEFVGVPKWSGRIGSDGDPLLGPSGLVPTYTHIITYTAVYTLHNDAANISHDSYRIIPTNSPGGIWGPAEYASMSGQVVNFVGMNGGGINPGTGILIVTEVEWAVAVSPVADVWITKEVTPTTVRYGDWITFTLTFTNVGSLPAQNVVITDTLPSQLANASWTGWLSNGGNIKARGGTSYVWDVADLARGEWGKVTVTAQVNAMDLNLVVNNTAKIGTSSVEQYQVAQKPNTATIPFNINNVTYNLDVTPISVTLSGYPGKSLYFDLVITNTGNVTDTINITHTFPITWTIAFTPTAPYILAPAESQAIRVCLVIPVEAEAGSREAEIVTFRLQGDPSVSVDVDVIVDILWRYIFLPIIIR